MDEEIYHLEKDDKTINEIQNLTECSFTREEARIHKTMIPEDEFGDHKDLDVPEMNAKAINSEPSSSIVFSVASLNTPTHDKNEFQELEADSQLHKVSDSLSFPQNSAEQQKGRAKLIRLQAVSSDTSEIILHESSFTKSDVMKTKDSNNQHYESGTVNTVPQFPCPMENYQFLVPPASASELPLYASTNEAASIQRNNSSNTDCDLIQRAMTTISDNPKLDYQQIILDIQNSELSMAAQDKISGTLLSTTKSSCWSLNSNNSTNDSTDGSSGSSILYQASNNETNESSNLQNLETINDISQAQPMQRFITADNQVVYGYKDSSGEFHFFSPTMNDRESHNEKERKRRGRVSEACGALRRMIPGVSEKTDKATVFEQAARYLKFLREKFGVQFDQVYCDKFYQERS